MATKPNLADNKAMIDQDRNHNIPEFLPILPLEGQVAFPGLNMTLAIRRDSFSLLEKAVEDNHTIGVLGVKNQSERQPKPQRFYETGTVVRILYLYKTRTADDQVILVVHGLTRFRITRWLSDKPYPRALTTVAPEIVEADTETEALHRNLLDLSQNVFSRSLKVSKGAVEGLARVKNPLHLAYIAAAHADIDFKTRQQLLEEDSLRAKQHVLVSLLWREKQVLSLEKKLKTKLAMS